MKSGSNSHDPILPPVQHQFSTSSAPVHLYFQTELFLKKSRIRRFLTFSSGFTPDLLIKDIGNSEKLVLLQAEAKNCRSLEINPIYLLVGIVLIVIILNSF